MLFSSCSDSVITQSPYHMKGKAMVEFIGMFPSAPYCFISFLLVILFPSPVAFCCCLLARNLFLLSSYLDYTWPYLGGVVPVMILYCAVTTWYSCIFGIYLIPFSPLEMGLQSSMILAIASQTWSLMLPLNMCLCLVSKSLMSS